MTKPLSFALSLLCFSFGAFAQEEPSLNFFDRETKTASDVDVGDGLRTLLTLPLVPDQKRLEVDIIVTPEYKLDESPLYQKSFKEQSSESRGVWQRFYKIPSFADKSDVIARFGRVARLRLSWRDPQNGNSGTLIRKYYLLEHKDQKFFKILSPGDLRAPQNADPESVCSYRKNLEIVGPYLQNPSLSPQEYEFNQSIAFEALRYRGPLNAQPLQRLGFAEGLTPLFQILESDQLGWLMTGWTHREGSDTKLSLRPKILLQPAQGGYFIKETLMKRFKAQKYAYRKHLGKNEWLADEVGLLDAGVTQFDFITLSFEDSQNPARLEELLKERSEMSTTCQSYPTENDRIFHLGPTNSLHEELFFTPLAD